MLIGGNKVAEGQDFLEENLPSFIPVSLAGRVHTKVVGPVHTGRLHRSVQHARRWTSRCSVRILSGKQNRWIRLRGR